MVKSKIKRFQESKNDCVEARLASSVLCQIIKAALASPAGTFPPVAMSAPTKIPAKSAGTTRFVIKARPMATSGGIKDQNPKSINDPMFECKASFV